MAKRACGDVCYACALLLQARSPLLPRPHTQTHSAFFPSIPEPAAQQPQGPASLPPLGHTHTHATCSDANPLPPSCRAARQPQRPATLPPCTRRAATTTCHPFPPAHAAQQQQRPATLPPLHTPRSNNNDLPPASPAAHELDVHNPEVTVFLIGAYAKYNWPYVWLRSMVRNHAGVDIDAPLDLPSTKRWKELGESFGWAVSSEWGGL
eukprot:271849-Chlamydomonas_euryale.AAC.1